MRVNGLILAAGSSRRMGDFKPLLPLDGKTMIENSIDSMLLAGVSSIVVTTGHRAAELEAVVRSRYVGDTIRFARNSDYAVTDMLTSIKIGLRKMPDCGAFFLLPGDMPLIRKETYLTLYRAMPDHGRAIVFPTLDGRRKHPPLIGSDLVADILRFEGTGGLRKMWHDHKEKIRTVPVDDVGCWTDLDTFEQYMRCLNRQQAAVN